MAHSTFSINLVSPIINKLNTNNYNQSNSRLSSELKSLVKKHDGFIVFLCHSSSQTELLPLETLSNFAAMNEVNFVFSKSWMKNLPSCL